VPAPPVRTQAAKRDRVTLLATAALVGVTAMWGSTFFLIHDLLDRVPAADFLALRFAIATTTLAVIAPRAVSRMSPLLRRRALLLGAVYGAGQILQTIGLETTSASVSGFITGLYVVATPLLAAPLLRQPIGGRVWMAVVLSTAGLAVLSLRGFSIGYGEALTLLAAVLFALHIVGLGAWSSAQDTIGLAVLQMAAVTVVCFVTAVPDGFVLPDRVGDWAAVLYMALAAGALGLVGQTWAQAHLPAARAAVVMTMEPVFAAAFAVAFGGEVLTVRVLVGGTLVLGAMYLVELAPRRRIEVEVMHLGQ
jgi:drug/metabolite transporter (DMT)-like permease